MKVLYAIQGTGNGHLSRARDVIPVLMEKCDLDILISGTQADVGIPYPVKYRQTGMSFIFGKKGGVDVWNTYVKSNMKRFRGEIENFPVQDYDLVINDFEPVSAWACAMRNVPCISLSHQSALLDKEVPKPAGKNLFGKSVLRYYAPAHQHVGLHFSRYSNAVYTPVIRREIRELVPSEKGHYTVYLPSYDEDQIIEVLNAFPDVEWQVFSKHSSEEKTMRNILIRPVSNTSFIKSMADARGILCGAGFETPAEALFLGKKLMVIPMKTQYEQQCNAEALRCMGVPVIPKLRKKHVLRISDWLSSSYRVHVNYPDITEQIISHTLESVFPKVSAMIHSGSERIPSLGDLHIASR